VCVNNYRGHPLASLTGGEIILLQSSFYF